MSETMSSDGIVGNPYADDEVVYTVTLVGGRRLTGTFYQAALRGPFWTLEVADRERESGWIALNPAYVVSVEPASEREFRRWRDGVAS